MKPVVLYIFLVGIPVAGVVGVLRVGENLRPPTFIGGAWEIQVGGEIAAAGSCGDAPARFNGATLNISQSGSALLLTLDNEPNTRLAGEICGVTATAGIAHQPVNEAPASDHSVASIQLRVQDEQHSKRDHLQGVLRLAGCPAHADVPFVATRRTLEK